MQIENKLGLYAIVRESFNKVFFFWRGGGETIPDHSQELFPSLLWGILVFCTIVLYFHLDRS